MLFHMYINSHDLIKSAYIRSRDLRYFDVVSELWLHPVYLNAIMMTVDVVFLHRWTVVDRWRLTSCVRMYMGNLER